MINSNLRAIILIIFGLIPIAAVGQARPDNPVGLYRTSLSDTVPDSGFRAPRLEKSKESRTGYPADAIIGSRPSGRFLLTPQNSSNQGIRFELNDDDKGPLPDYKMDSRASRKFPVDKSLLKTWTKPNYVSFENSGFEIPARDAVIESPAVSVKTNPDLFPVVFQASFGKGNSESDSFDPTPRLESSRIAQLEYIQARVRLQYQKGSIAFGGHSISRPNDQEYISSDGYIEFSEDSRSLGFDMEAQLNLTERVSFSATYSRILDAVPQASDQASFTDAEPVETITATVDFRRLRFFDLSIGWKQSARIGLDWSDSNGSLFKSSIFRVSAEKHIADGIHLNLLIDDLFNNGEFETIGLFRSRLFEACSVCRSGFENQGSSRALSIGLKYEF